MLNSNNNIDAIEAVSTPQPEFSEAAATRVLTSDFGLIGDLTPLVSERDQNFRVVVEDGRRFVFKIANRAESDLVTDLQIKVLQHLETQGCAVATPIVQRTLASADSSLMLDGDTPYVCRVVSYLAGTPLSEIELSGKLAEDFGRCAATVDLALADFSHVAENQTLLWDLQRTAELRDLLPYIEKPELHAAVGRCLDDFDQYVQPALSALRQQVIHADLNPDNVLALTDEQAIAGVIDFGDMTRAPLIMEVAIAASYLRVDNVDALALIRPFVAGFHSVLPLEDAELALMFDLVRARLAATISILRWRAATRGESDEYSSQFLLSERSAETFLARIDRLGRGAFADSLFGLQARSMPFSAEESP